MNSKESLSIITSTNTSSPPTVTTTTSITTSITSTTSFLDTLADIASKTIPLKPSNLKFEDEEKNRFIRKPRAMSEPWIRGSTLPSLYSHPEYHHNNNNNNKKDNNNNNNITSYSSSSSSNIYVLTLPQMLEKYSSIYNRNGRIGIYTREERDAIISKFYEKRKRRVWVKKIRYHCRKNLADNRIRVKGRFVRITEHDNDHDNYNDIDEIDDNDIEYKDHNHNNHDDHHENNQTNNKNNSRSTKINSKIIKNSLMTDALNGLLLVSERKLDFQKNQQIIIDDVQSNASGTTSISSQSQSQSLRLKNKRRSNGDNKNNDNNHNNDNNNDSTTINSHSPSSIPPEEMTLVENVRSRKRIRRHSIAY